MIRVLCTTAVGNAYGRIAEDTEQMLQGYGIKREDIISVNYAISPYDVISVLILYEDKENENG